MREQTEVPVVRKEARVMEEVRVGKTSEERDETIHETLRNTDVAIEGTNRNTTGGTLTNNTDPDRDNDRDLTGRNRDL